MLGIANNSRLIAIASIFSTCLVACAHQGAPLPEEKETLDYLIGREDVLEISVWRDADLSRTVPVRPDGRISLPLIGEVDAAGKTPDAVAFDIKNRLAPFIEEPRVAVIVREVNAPRYFVIGEVGKPGSYQLRNKTTVLQALSVAGGPNEFANKRGIVILREKKVRFELNYSDLVENSTHDILLRPGDTIYVP